MRSSHEIAAKPQKCFNMGLELAQAAIHKCLNLINDDLCPNTIITRASQSSNQVSPPLLKKTTSKPKNVSKRVLLVFIWHFDQNKAFEKYEKFSISKLFKQLHDDANIINGRPFSPFFNHCTYAISF